jgi:glycosyltransferase involved in cell wall biosynthesis
LVVNIAVNTRLLLNDRLEGIGWFMHETLKRITALHPECTFHFLFDRRYSDEFVFSPNVVPHNLFPQARHPFLYYLWFEHSVPFALKRIKPDLFLSPDGYLSLSTPVRSMAVFHDLNFEHRPQDFPVMDKLYYRHYFPKFARKACRIATVSEFSKGDINTLYGIPPEKIDVVYSAAKEVYGPLPESAREEVRRQYTAGRPYFLYVGSLHPRKNVANLFRAYDAFREASGGDFRLLVVGAKKWWTAEIREAYEGMKHRDDVIFTGRLATRELARVTASALAITYISFFEGFGVPITEGFHCDVPVIASRAASMPEVGGDAVLYADPHSVESISGALQRMATDTGLRNSLIERGRVRKNLFSWQKTADLLWHSIERALE